MARTPRPVPAPAASADAGRLVLRLTLGILILFHGVAKIMNGPGAVAGLLQAHQLPAELAYLVYIGEVLAPLALIAGAWTRLAAAVVVVNMLVAFSLAHLGQLLSVAPTGGWALELQGMYLLTALAIVLLGAGRFSLGGTQGAFN